MKSITLTACICKNHFSHVVVVQSIRTVNFEALEGWSYMSTM
jgi:hypothetical protein